MMKTNKSISGILSLFDLSHLSITEDGKRISVFSLALPALMQQVLLTVIGTVNTYMISGYAENAVGATAAASQLITLVNTLPGMVSVGAGVLINIELGRRDKERAAHYAGAATVFAAILGTIISTVFILFSRPMLSLMNLTGDALDYGTSYLSIYGGAMVMAATASTLTGIMVCHGHNAYTTVKSIAVTLISVVLGYTFLKLDIIPAISGTVAIALGSTVAVACDLAATLVLIRLLRVPIRPNASLTTLKRLMQIGIPGGAPGLSYMLAQTITTSFMAMIAIEALNAKSYVSSIVQYTYFVSAALSTGVRIMMGRYAGRGELYAMKRLAASGTVIAMLSNGIFSLAVFLMHRPLIALFTQSEQIISMSTAVFAIDIAVEIVRAANHVLESSLNATRDVYTTLIASVASCWLGSVVLSYVLGIQLGLGLIGCWIAFAADEIIKATVYFIRWRSGKWRRSLGI